MPDRPGGADRRENGKGRLRGAPSPPADLRVLLQVVEEPQPTPSRLDAFLRHPTTLLLAGFLFTGVLGSWLTAYWKTSEWQNQQLFLQEQRALEQKYKLLSETVEAVSETLVAASDVITIAYWDWDVEERASEVEERRRLWIGASRAWRRESRVIRFELATHFGDPEADAAFQQIVNKRRQLGVKTRSLLEKIADAQGGSLPPQSRAEAEEINGLINTISDQMIQLGSILGKHLED